MSSSQSKELFRIIASTPEPSLSLRRTTPVLASLPSHSCVNPLTLVWPGNPGDGGQAAGGQHKYVEQYDPEAHAVGVVGDLAEDEDDGGGGEDVQHPALRDVPGERRGGGRGGGREDIEDADLRDIARRWRSGLTGGEEGQQVDGRRSPCMGVHGGAWGCMRMGSGTEGQGGERRPSWRSTHT